MPRALDRQLDARRRPDRQPRRARAAGRDRQLVRAPAGQALRRRPGRVGDGLELRRALPQRAHLPRAAADPPRRAPGLGAAVRPRPRRDGLGGRAGRGGRRRPDRHQHGLPGAQGLQDRRRRGAAGRPRRARSRSPGPRRAAAGCRSRSSCAPGCGPATTAASRSPGGWSTTAASPGSASTRATPRSATAARPTTSSPRALVEELPVPVLISGGLHTAERPATAFERTGADGGAAGPRVARQPVAVRAAARPARRRAERARRSSPSSTG